MISAGQTIDHVSVHVIHRWFGNVSDPRMGTLGASGQSGVMERLKMALQSEDDQVRFLLKIKGILREG